MVIDNSSAYRMDPARAAGGARGQRGRPRGSRRHRRQPQLRGRAAGGGAQADRRRRRPGARHRLELPVGERHRPGGRRRELREQTAGLPGRRRARARRSTRTRSPSTCCPTSTSSTRTATPARSRRSPAETRKMLGLPDLAGQRHLRPRAGAPRRTPRRSTSRPPTRITADAARSLLMVAPGVVAGGRARPQPLPAGPRRRRAATRCSWAASARTPRTRGAWCCGS